MYSLFFFISVADLFDLFLILPFCLYCPISIAFFLSDHYWWRLFTAFGYFRTLVDFAPYGYHAAVLLATLIDRYTRNGKKDNFFLGYWKITRQSLLSEIIRARWKVELQDTE